MFGLGAPVFATYRFRKNYKALVTVGLFLGGGCRLNEPLVYRMMFKEDAW